MTTNSYIPIDLRFWQKVRFGQGIDDCWEWTGFLFPTGHGQFHMGDRDVKAHRAAWLIYNGPLESEDYICPLESEDYICHLCDNPKCVRLDHLYKGTHATNQADRRGKPRYQNENAPRPKLNWETVRAIRSMQRSHTKKEIAGMFDISSTTVGRIWSEVGPGGWREEVPLNG